MLACLYDLIFCMPICIAATLFSWDYYTNQPVAVTTYLVVTIYMTIFVGVKNLETRLKVVLLFVVLFISGLLYGIDRYNKGNYFIADGDWLIPVFFICLSFFLGCQIIKRVKKLCLVGSVGCFLFLVVNQAFGGHLRFAGVCMLLVWALILITEYIQYTWEKGGYKSPKEHMVSLSPFFVLWVMMLLFMPVSNEPYRWDIVRNIVKQLREKGITISQFLFNSVDNYGDAFLGFSEKNSFGGDVKKSDRSVMTLTFFQNDKYQIYLTGKVFDTFDGKKWISKNEETAPERMLDTIESYAGILSQNTGVISDYLRISEVNITFLEYSSRYAFAPTKLVTNYDTTVSGKLSQRGGDLLFSKLMQYRTNYIVRYYRMNRDHPIYKPVWDNSSLVSAETWEKAKRTFGRANEEAYSYENYLSYVDSIYRFYLPDTKLSDKAMEYIQMLTKDAKNDYEKLVIIEKLFGSMEYTLSPGPVPSYIKDAAGFVDYMLFEKQAGYCSHYATTFALIARALNIPARYIQGFQVNSETPNVVVTDSFTHAWPECYIRGFGWVRFEPTPGMKNTIQWITSDEIIPQTPANRPAKESEIILPPQKEKESKTSKTLSYILIIVLVVIVVVPFLVVFDRIISARRYQKMEIKKRFMLCVRKNERMLRLLHFSMGDSETTREFMQRIQPNLSKEAVSFLLDLESFLYGNNENFVVWLENAERANEALAGILKEKSKLRYMISIMLGLPVQKRLRS